MPDKEPVAYFDGSFSSPGVEATLWSDARTVLDEAEIFWLSTVRTDGRPHVTPLLGVLVDGSLYFSTGPDERKAKNLRLNAHCIVTTGTNTLGGLDLVVEGDATEVTDESERRSVADRFESKYGSHFVEPDGTWAGLGDAVRSGDALLYRIAPSRAFGFLKGGPYSQTRWDFL